MAGSYVGKLALILLIIGGLNWGLIGLFGFNLVTFLFHAFPIVERVIYILVGLAAVTKVYYLFYRN